MELKVLDKGFVRLENFSGGDESVIRSARVSYGQGSKGEEADRKLIAYMLQNKHGSPFEHSLFTFHIKCPIFVVRQWHRHRVGHSYNEISGRYSKMKEEYYVPEKWRAQDKKNKQGSVETKELDHARLSDFFRLRCDAAFSNYHTLLDNGVAREMARMVLPVNWYTEFYHTCNARSLMHFIELRSEQHAQWEIRQYSDAMFKIFIEKMPETAEAFLHTLSPEKYVGLELPG